MLTIWKKILTQIKCIHCTTESNDETFQVHNFFYKYSLLPIQCDFSQNDRSRLIVQGCFFVVCTCTKAGQADELWCRFRYLDKTETVPGKEESGTLTCDKVQVSLLEKSASYFVLTQLDIFYHLQQNAS